MVDAGYRRNRLHIRGLRLLRLLLCDVEICDRHREEAVCGRKAMTMSAGPPPPYPAPQAGEGKSKYPPPLAGEGRGGGLEITGLHKWFREVYRLADSHLTIG